MQSSLPRLVQAQGGAGSPSMPSSPAGTMGLGSPAGAMTLGAPSPFGTGRLAPITGRMGTSSGPAGPSAFESAHAVQLKKHRVQYMAMSESLEIDFKASHSKAASLVPQLQKKFSLEAEEIQHDAEEQVSKQINRIQQLRQEFQLSMKEMQRKHVEGQQRRIAGGTVNLDPASPDMQNTLSASVSRYPTAPSSPVPRGGHAGDTRNGTASVGGAGDVGPSASAPAPPPVPPMTMPASPGAHREFSNEFARLESTHEKFIGRMGRNHERCLQLRADEVSAWEVCKEGCQDALRKHHTQFTELLESKVRDLQTYIAGQRAKLGAKQADVAGREERLRKALEGMIAAAVHKLATLLAEYLSRDVPTTEAALTELNNAHAKHQRTLWAELQAQLEVHEGALRDLLPVHVTAVSELQNSCFDGLAEHEKIIANTLTEYMAGIHTLQAQYDNVEQQHLSNLSIIRTEHLRQLQNMREGYLGEVAGLLEEYRARLAELKQQFLLRHDADLAEA